LVGPDFVVDPLVEGCDISLTLGGSGWEEQAHPDCETDLSADPGEWARVSAGDPLDVQFEDVTFDSWTPFAFTVICGRLSGLFYVAEPEPGCFLEPTPGEPFAAPDEPGRWTLALAACAGQDTNPANQACGTWYANVEIVSAGRERGSTPRP